MDDRPVSDPAVIPIEIHGGATTVWLTRAEYLTMVGGEMTCECGQCFDCEIAGSIRYFEGEWYRSRVGPHVRWTTSKPGELAS